MNLDELAQLVGEADSVPPGSIHRLMKMMVESSAIDIESRSIEAELSRLVEREQALATRRGAFTRDLEQATFAIGERLRLARSA
jgi:hypothetical protein